jgi:hypothetical protein
MYPTISRYAYMHNGLDVSQMLVSAFIERFGEDDARDRWPRLLRSTEYDPKETVEQADDSESWLRFQYGEIDGDAYEEGDR